MYQKCTYFGSATYSYFWSHNLNARTFNNKISILTVLCSTLNDKTLVPLIRKKLHFYQNFMRSILINRHIVSTTKHYKKEN